MNKQSVAGRAGKKLFSFGGVSLALAILTISIFRSASVSYVFTTPIPDATKVLSAQTSEIDYQLPFPGKVLPDSPIWTIKVIRDRIWLALTFDPQKKAELNLLFADKRLAASRILFESGKPDIAFSVLSKGEKYLELSFEEENRAREAGAETSDFLLRLSLASLKHRQIIEDVILPLSPDDAKPGIIRIEDYSKNTYKNTRDALNSKGKPTPISPFDRQ